MICWAGAAMAIILIVGVVGGIVLGFRFRVMVLVETILIAATFIVMIGFGDGYSIPVIAVAVVGITTSLQVGYVAGCLIQLLPIVKARRHYSTSKPVNIDT